LDSAFLHSLKLTFLTVVAVTAAEVLLGLGIALIFDRGIKASNLLLQIIVTPMMVAPVVVGLIWYILFHNIIGPINYALSLVGIQGPDWVNSTSTSLLSIAIADVWQWTPFTFLLLFSILRTVPLSMYEAARIDGASSFRIFWHVTLPMIKGMIWVTAILRSMDAFKMFDIIYVMTFGGPGNSTELVAIRIFKAAFLEYRFSYSAAMVIVLLAIISSLYLIYLKYADRESV
jgi:multiple sugar transport system permease protein